jgi:hypothetical protein
MRRALVVALLLVAGCAPATPEPAPEIASPARATAVVSPPARATASVPVLTLTATRVATCRSVGGLPDRTCTPGKTNTAVRPDSIGSTICATGWTATIRPPVQVTDRIKVERMKAYGYEGQPPSAFELDHLISLELGGHPDDPLNLWPQAYAPPDGSPGAHEKDQLENLLKAEVCQGKVSLAWAQQAISTDWISALKHGGQP